jgi:hypothetical protein
VYVTNNNSSRLQIFDVSNPSSPVSVGLITTSRPSGIYVQGRYAYVTSFNLSTLQIFDVLNPSLSVSVGSASTGSFPYGVYVQGRYVYVVNAGSSTLQIFDVSNPSSPTSVGSVSTGSYPYGVYVQGRYAYVTNLISNTLQIFDVSNPSSPTSVGSVPTGTNPNSVYVQGRYAYVTNGVSNTLQIFDVSNPSSPVLVGSVSTGSGPGSVYVQGRYVYVANYSSNTLQIFDVSGSYIQQLEAGGVLTNTLESVGNATIGNDLAVVGGLNVSQSTNILGNLSATNMRVVSGLTANTISATTYQNLPTDVNIYNTNGTLTGARSVNLSGNQLTFSSSTTGTNVIGLYGSGNTSTSRTYFEMGQRNNGGFSSSVFFTSFAPNYSDTSWGSFYSGSSMLSAYHENPVTTGGFGNLFFDISQFGSTVANRYFAWHAAPVTTARSLSTEMMRLHILGNGDGNLGINTKGVPTQKLHVSGNTLIEGSLSANTISATTYQNLPTDVRVTGGTYSSGTATFTNNTGGTFNVTGFSTNSNGIVGISNSSGLYTYYSTISDAMSAATSGQTIEIFADIIETSAVTVTLKNGVTINGNGHTYILNVSGSTDAFIIPINSTSYMYNINIRLLTSTGAVIRSNPNTTLIGNGVLSSNSSSGYVVDASGANSNLNISGFKIVTESSKNGVFLANGSYADNLTIYSTSGVGLTVGDSARAFDCTVIASSPTSYAAYVYGGLFNSVVYSYGGSNSTAVKLQGSDNLVYPRGLYNCNIISLLGDGLIMENQMDVDNTTVISYGSGKLALKFEITAVSAFTDFNNCTFKSVNGPCVNQVLRWVSFTDCYLFAGSGSCITNSFNNSTYNRVRVRGGFIEVAHNSSSSHGIVLSDNTSHEISSCKFSLANASSYALKSQGASTTAKYLQNTFQGPTTPVDPNVTQGMINTEDVYGNILI